jgi:hypothetical protein
MAFQSFAVLALPWQNSRRTTDFPNQSLFTCVFGYFRTEGLAD